MKLNEQEHTISGLVVVSRGVLFYFWKSRGAPGRINKGVNDAYQKEGKRILEFG